MRLAEQTVAGDRHAPVSRGVAILDLDLSAKNDAQLQAHGLPPTWRALWVELTAEGVEVEILNPGRRAVEAGDLGLRPGRFGTLVLHVDNFLPPLLAEGLERLKRESPGIEVLACGYLATVEPVLLLDRLGAVDAVVRGPLESVLPALSRVLSGEGEVSSLPNYLSRKAGPAAGDYRKPWLLSGETGDGYLRVSPELLARHGLQGGIGILQGSAGCPCRCAFCRTGSFYRAYSRNPYSLRPIGDLLREIEHLARHCGVRHFKLYDNNFLGTPRLAPRRAAELAAGLRGLDLPLSFELHCRTEAVLPEVLDTLVPAGLRHLAMGIESMSVSQLARFEKGESVEQHRRAAGLVAARGIRAQGYSILADPLVTREELAESLAGLRELADSILILVHERMILYATAPYSARHRGAIRGVVPLPSSLGTVLQYELQDPWCQRYFAQVEEASQRFKRALADFHAERLAGLDGTGLHRFVQAGTRLRLELMQRVVECGTPTLERVERWLADAVDRIPAIAGSLPPH